MSASGTTFRVTEEMYVIDCGNCHVLFAIPNEMDERLRESHETFYCPNGHSRVYAGKTAAQRATERAQRAEEQLRATRELLEHEERRRAAAQGQVTKLKNRVKNGVCPECNRHFVNVERHMTTQHGGTG